MSESQLQYLRKITLIVAGDQKGLDLSDCKIRFQVMAADFQSPNHAVIRVYNLTPETIAKVRAEYSRVVLQAGYEQASFGVIFDGTIKQFRIGKEDAITTFLDIMAADGDVGYNFGICNKTWAAGTTQAQIVRDTAQQMGLDVGALPPDLTGSNPASLPRGKVGFGMGRDIMRKVAETALSTWSIQNGVIQIIPLQGYLAGEAVVLNSATGMIGIPEQTDEGIRVRSLLNPRLRIGGTIRLNNRDINQLEFKDPFEQSIGAGVAFNSYTGIAFASRLAVGTDGLYRIYVAEHSGDTRGQEWYSDLVCLAINQSSNLVEARD